MRLSGALKDYGVQVIKGMSLSPLYIAKMPHWKEIRI
jgi:hypothetical protein